MDLIGAWREILDVSGLTDLASEAHGNDLLDGLAPPSEDLGEVFRTLCRREGVTGWADVESVLSRLRTVSGFELLRLPEERIDRVLDGPATGIAHHTSISRGTYQSTWGTPQAVLEIVRDLFGPITLDLASSEEHNAIVQARAYYSVERPCPSRPDVTSGDVVWCNPPGPCSHVAEFWAAWLHCVGRARGGFLLYNLDHLRQLPAPAIALMVIVLRRRLRFRGARQGASFPSALVLSPCTVAPQGCGHILRWP